MVSSDYMGHEPENNSAKINMELIVYSILRPSCLKNLKSKKNEFRLSLLRVHLLSCWFRLIEI